MPRAVKRFECARVTLGNSIRSRARSPFASLPVLLLAFSVVAAAQPTLPEPQQEPTAVEPSSPPSPTETQGPPTVGSDQTPEGATVSAEGVVRTSDGSPIPGATIRLVNTDTQKAWVTWTDISGKFEFPAVPPGHYTATATALGFQQASPREAQLATGGSKPIELVLRVSTLA
jgi:Carboxypeptidase regulatory-like domain